MHYTKCVLPPKLHSMCVSITHLCVRSGQVKETHTQLLDVFAFSTVKINPSSSLLLDTWAECESLGRGEML